MPKTTEPNRYSKLIQDIFFRHYKKGDQEIVFERAELIETATRLGIELPKNLGDVTYTFRYRGTLPPAILAKAPQDKMWAIQPAGRGRYKFVLTRIMTISPNASLVETKIPDATPGIIAAYSQNDEQALLAKIRYNRLVDIFTGLTCYSLQNHLRTTVKGIGQIETDEIYVGLDKRGAQYVLPVQAKTVKERFGIVQIEQDIAMCAEKFPDLICRAIAAQFMADDRIAMFELELSDAGLAIANERHYRLVRPDELTAEELRGYQARPA